MEPGGRIKTEGIQRQRHRWEDTYQKQSKEMDVDGRMISE
jgi:hypothetical protein